MYKRQIVHTVENILGKKIVAGEIKNGDKVEVVLVNDAYTPNGEC